MFCAVTLGGIDDGGSVCVVGRAWKLLTEEILQRKCNLSEDSGDLDESPIWDEIKYLRQQRIEKEGTTTGEEEIRIATGWQSNFLNLLF